MHSLSCRQLTGVGEKVAEKLARLGMTTVLDLLFHLPVRYEDRTRVCLVRDLTCPTSAVLDVVVEQVSFPLKGRTRLHMSARDASGRVSLRFFHVYPQQKKILQPGVRLRCFGVVRMGLQGPEMIHPEYRIAGTHTEEEKHLTPVYPVADGVSQSLLRRLVAQALVLVTKRGELAEILPPAVLDRLQLPALQAALQFVHFPPADAPQKVLSAFRHPAQQRLIFEELLAHRLGLLDVKQSITVLRAVSFTAPGTLIDSFIGSLPYRLTAAQNRVWQDICRDVSKPRPMLRLVQGDVGCGKTVVAALAVLKAVENNTQAALLAPTELLAEQHYQTFQRWLVPLGIRVDMLASKTKAGDRRRILADMAAGQTQVLVGTHAIFQKEVTFASLALLVVDEQHRFGVQQRLWLREKGVVDGRCPHQLILTATPIPRTLAMSVYADLDCSVIDELPPGRLPVVTRLLPDERRPDIFDRLRQASADGRQVYWVCPRIEESEDLDWGAVEARFAEMVEALPHLRIGRVHGRMKSAEKEQVMSAFRAGELQVLVATTVIEVGVDVPAASVMVIEDAQRLGLAQLHQLRGRVGRGHSGGFCLLLYRGPLSSFAQERLKVMRDTTDGFVIAQRDLELRGPGEVLGVRQTGEASLRIADLLRDGDLLPHVQQVAESLLKEDPIRAGQLVKRWVGEREGYGYV